MAAETSAVHQGLRLNRGVFATARGKLRSLSEGIREDVRSDVQIEVKLRRWLTMTGTRWFRPISMPLQLTATNRGCTPCLPSVSFMAYCCSWLLLKQHCFCGARSTRGHMTWCAATSTTQWWCCADGHPGGPLADAAPVLHTAALLEVLGGESGYTLPGCQGVLIRTAIA
ncbi:hypothetical protein HaLaN_08860 [Haematococcus lacustris]|uniref:Uncharacterized protein n=1 Tax=Haematococcus lacustris TaxID=44745 RepID=A0A699YUZ6_HAELA|nr:hypothetical protein HaLaN_08860 [Haematococcus lacustris]